MTDDTAPFLAAGGRRSASTSRRSTARASRTCPRCSAAAPPFDPDVAVRPAGPPAARARDAAARAVVQARHPHQRRARAGARGAHGRAARRRARGRAQLVHVGPDARGAGRHRRTARTGRAPELHVLGVGARGHVERARPRFVECSGRSFQIDLADTARHIEGASAIIATHVFGAPCNARELEELARAYGHPAHLRRRARARRVASTACRSARSATAEVFSLTPTKPLVAGEGGLVATNDSGAGRTAAHRSRLRQPRRLRHPVRRAERPHVGVPRRDGARVARRPRPGARTPAVPRHDLPQLPRRRARHRVPDVLRPRHEHVQGPDDPRRRRRVRRLPRRARRSRCSPKASTPASTSIRRCTASARTVISSTAACPSPTRSPRACCRCPVYPDLTDEHVERVCEVIRSVYEHSVELDAYVSTMSEVDARIFELD